MSAGNRWDYKKLPDLADFINGYAFKPEDWGEEGLPIIRIEQLKDPSSVTDFFSGSIPEKNIIQNGDLIFSWSASLFLRIWQNGRAALNQHSFKVIEKPNVDRFFLKQFIDFYLPELSRASHGSTMQHITRKELKRFGAQVPLDKKEQSKIAEVLTTIEKTIEQAEALIAKQQRIKIGLMHDLLTRGIDKSGKIRPCYSAEPEIYYQTDAGIIPIDWSPRQLGKVATLQRGFDITEGQIIDGPYPVVSSSGIIGNHIQKTSKGPNVVVGRKGTIGKVHYLEFDFWAHDTSLFVTNFFGNNERYIYYLFNFLGLARLGTKSGSPSLNRNDIHPLWVGLPDLDEQIQIVAILLETDNGLEDLRRHVEKLSRLKSGLMQDLLTGKVPVTSLLNKAETAA